MDIWNSFKKWFRDSEESPPSRPFIHEMIERTEEDLRDFSQWKESAEKSRLLEWLNEQYATYLIEPEELDTAIDFLNTSSSKGFVIHLDRTNYNKRTITHFFDFIKERILAMNYKSYVSDIRTYNRSMAVEMVQRHYLKPRVRFLEGEKVKQLFGNINVELVMRNEELHHLKFSATSYKDRMVHDADEFKDLMKHILVSK